MKPETMSSKTAAEQYTIRLSELLEGRYQIIDAYDNCIGVVRDLSDASMMVRHLNAAYMAGQESRWIPVSERTEDGEALLLGPAYNDPSIGEYWQRTGFYQGGILYENDEFDRWKGYSPTHWQPLPTPPNT